MFRIGHGYDVHAFEEGDHLMIGGVKIAHTKQFKAHSDGDVLLHAITDALLGALAMGDIGRHFPDTDPQFKDINSRDLLTHVVGLISEKGYVVGNIDATIVAQRPKLAGYIDQMRDFIATDCDVGIDVINVKATTSEWLGFEGREEGISSHAVCLLIKRELLG